MRTACVSRAPRIKVYVTLGWLVVLSCFIFSYTVQAENEKGLSSRTGDDSLHISVAFAECSGLYKAMSLNMSAERVESAERMNQIGADVGVTAAMIASLSMDWDQATALIQHIATTSASRWDVAIRSGSPSVLDHYVACDRLGVLDGDLAIQQSLFPHDTR